MHRSETIAALATALSAAQAEIAGARKDAQNTHFRNQYATLESAIEACKAVLPKHGLSWSQFPSLDEHGNVVVETILMHKSGEWLSGALALPVSKKDAQGVGSAITYGRRYSLMAVVGIAPEDDDGAAAASGGEVREMRAAPRPQQAPPPKQTPHVAQSDLLDWDDLLEEHPFGQLDAKASRPVFSELQKQLLACNTSSELHQWASDSAETIWSLHQQARHFLREKFNTQADRLPETLAEIA